MQPHTIDQFNRLTNKEKWAILEDHAVYLISRIDGSFQIALFYLYPFYVEVYLNQVTDKLIKARAFDDYLQLDPFLIGIDITAAYSVL